MAQNHGVKSSKICFDLGVVGLTALVVFGVVSPPEASAQAKVSQFDVSITINQDVVGFDVSMDKTHFVDAFHSTGELCDVKLSQVLLENAHSDQKTHHVPARDVVHDKIQVIFILEGVVQADDPLIICFSENVPLSFHMGHLVSQQDVFFTEGLHGIQRSRVHFPSQTHFSKRPNSQSLDLIKHGFVHFGALEADVVGFLLGQHHAHLFLCVARKPHLNTQDTD